MYCYLEDILDYVDVPMAIKRYPTQSSSTTLSKYKCRIQLALRNVPMIAIDVKFNLAEDEATLQRQEAQLYKYVFSCLLR